MRREPERDGLAHLSDLDPRAQADFGLIEKGVQ
jgi:hypothetical protein